MNRVSCNPYVFNGVGVFSLGTFLLLAAILLFLTSVVGFINPRLLIVWATRWHAFALAVISCLIVVWDQGLFPAKGNPDATWPAIWTALALIGAYVIWLTRLIWLTQKALLEAEVSGPAGEGVLSDDSKVPDDSSKKEKT